MNPVLDYTDDGKRDILCKIYVGDSDTPLAISYTPYATSSHYDPGTLGTFRITSLSDTAADLYLDNTRFWQAIREFDEGGMPPVENDDPIGNNVFDKDGWS